VSLFVIAFIVTKAVTARAATSFAALGAGRANPLGLSLQLDAFATWGLYASDNVVLEKNFVRPLLTATLSPSRAQGGVGLEFQPVSVLGFRTSFQGQRYFGSFGHLHAFPSTSFAWDDDDLTRRDNRGPDAVRAEGSGEVRGQRGGQVFSASTYIQFKAGPLLSRTEGGVARTRLDLPPGLPTFYDPGEDLLVRNRGYATFVNADLLLDAIPDAGWRTGVSLRTFDARAYGAPNGSRMRNARLGPTALWQFAPSQLAALLVHWYAVHPYRARGNRAFFPSVAVAYQFERDDSD
jgi:hypothetical protein